MIIVGVSFFVKIMKMKALRKGAGLSQQELARRVGVTSVTVSNWDSGKTLPHLNPKQFSDLLGALNCALSDLVLAQADWERSATDAH